MCSIAAITGIIIIATTVVIITGALITGIRARTTGIARTIIATTTIITAATGADGIGMKRAPSASSHVCPKPILLRLIASICEPVRS